MTLEDFRRLSEDLNERLAILKQKMERLAAEGYQFKVAGVAAWKQSAVFTLYLEAARESLKRALSVADTLAALAKEGKSALSMEEFTTIGQFNRWVGL